MRSGTVALVRAFTARRCVARVLAGASWSPRAVLSVRAACGVQLRESMSTILDVPFRSGAFAIIRNAEGAVLLGHRRDLDLWDSSGRKGGGEAPWDAAVRETAEEVGLDVVVESMVDLAWKPEEQELVFTFECRVTGGSPSLSDEADAVAYFRLGDLPGSMSPAKRERILNVASAGGVVLSTRVGPSVRDLIARGEL